MKNERLPLLLSILCLLGLGILLAQAFPQLGESGEHAFGTELWIGRRLDLMVQLGLVFVGALGIRALLPEKDEGE